MIMICHAPVTCSRQPQFRVRRSPGPAGSVKSSLILFGGPKEAVNTPGEADPDPRALVANGIRLFVITGSDKIIGLR
ncbi:hypothetical protein ACRAVF_20885 [Bradyrhizobium oligotrophicum S58]